MTICLNYTSYNLEQNLTRGMSNFAKRRIWKYLLILDPNDRSRFNAWLKLELQDRQVSVQRLWQNLRCLDEAEVDRLSKQQFAVESSIWSLLFPNDPFEEARFRKLSEQLIRHIEEFLAIEGFRKDQEAKDLYLLREIGLRNSFQLFQTIYRKVKSRLNRKTIRDEQFFKNHTLFDREFQNARTKFDAQAKFDLSKFFQSFDKWRLIEQANMLIFQLYAPKDAPVPVVPAAHFFESLKNHNEYAKEPILHIYTLLFELLNGTSEDFRTYFNFLQSYKHKINGETLQSLFINATNYIVRKASQTREKIYYEQYADLMDWGLKNQLLMANGILASTAYKNVISINLILAKKLEGPDKQVRIIQAKRYLENLKNYLPEKDREDAYRFNKAIYYFTIGEYNKVEASLGGRPYSNISFVVQGRLYGLMARYEMKEYTYLPTAIRSLKRYVQIHTKKDLPLHVYTVFLEHLRFFNRLVQAYTTEDYSKLRKAINKTPRVYEKNWLLEKVDENIPNSKLLTTD